MKNILKSITFGIIQSLTEFLPISSSGHLFIFKKFTNANLPIIFDIYLHFATVCVIFIYYRKRIIELILTLFNFCLGNISKLDFENLKLILILVVITFITGIVGIFLYQYRELFSLNLVLFNFFITGILLFFLKIRFFKLDFRNIINIIISGVFIGLMQGIGTMPGISRSGITIFAAVFLGFSTKKALEISFLSLIPVVFGGVILKYKDFNLDSTFSFFEINIGAITSFILSLILINFLMDIFKSQKLYCFSIYLFLLSGFMYFFSSL